MKASKTVSLVLGSGGARGYAHIGVIEELERCGYEIVSISGSSMGTLVGALYASGRMQEFKEWVMELDGPDLAEWLDVSWNIRSGVFRGTKVMQKLAAMIGDRKIEELPIKYTAVATDLNRNKEVWFQEGDLLDAVRASIAIPAILTPVEMKGMLLVDGGVLNPLPVAPTMSDHTDMTIAVNLYADLPKPDIPVPDSVSDRESGFVKALGGVLHKAQDAFFKENERGLPVFEVLEKTLDSVQRTLISYHLGNYPPDVLINISKDVCGTFDFHKAFQTIEAGRMAAREVLSALSTDPLR